MKTAFKDFLPDAIFKRRKMGFGVPISRWFRNELKDYVYEILLDPKTLNRGYFKREGIERLLNDHIGLRYDHSAKIWALLFLEIWFRVFMDKEGDLLFICCLEEKIESRFSISEFGSADNPSDYSSSASLFVVLVGILYFNSLGEPVYELGRWDDLSKSLHPEFELGRDQENIYA